MILFDPSDSAVIVIDWADFLGGAVTLTAVTHSVDAPMSKVAASDSNTTTTSQAKFTGAEHGGMYMVTAQATLSSGETINRQFPIRGWNS